MKDLVVGLEPERPLYSLHAKAKLDPVPLERLSPFAPSLANRGCLGIENAVVQLWPACGELIKQREKQQRERIRLIRYGLEPGIQLLWTKAALQNPMRHHGDRTAFGQALQNGIQGDGHRCGSPAVAKQAIVSETGGAWQPFFGWDPEGQIAEYY